MADDSESDNSSVTSFVSSTSSVPQMQPVSVQLPYDVIKTWTSIYPAYLNYSLTVAQGRRLPKSKCEGCE